MTEIDDGTPHEPAQTERILDRMTDGVFGLNPSWEFTYLNEQGRAVICEASGEMLTREQLVGRNIWELIPEARNTTFETKYREAMRTGDPVVFDERYEPLDIWLEVRAYPSETGLTVCFRDVTERRREREMLKTREAALREMYDAIADRESSFEDRVDNLLRIGQRIFGTTHGTLSRVQGDEYVFEVVRAPSDDIQSGDTVDLDTTNCERVVLTEETLVLGNIAENAPELTDRAGYTEWGISCYLGTPVEVDGEVYGTFCFYDTEPRQSTFSDWEVTLLDLMGRWVSVALERKLAQERLERQNDRLEEFASIVSHDLRNPLNVAGGWLEVARDEHDSEALQKIEASHERMTSIIDDVLTLARAGRDIEDPADLSLEQVATDAWAQVRTADAVLDVEADRAVRGDTTRLQRLFENLFRNSVEHGSTDNRRAPRAGDSVEHGSTNSRPAADDSVEHSSTDSRTQSGDSVEHATSPGLTVTVGALPTGFYVEDDGAGIDPEHRTDILEFGYSTAEGGTGIGLGVVADIASAHGWEVAVGESDAGGARFEFTNVT